MRVAELIKKLDEILIEHGDVKVMRDDHTYSLLEIDDCNFEKEIDPMLSDEKNFCYLS